MVLVDTHAHLHFKRCSRDVDEVVERFKRAGGSFLINVGIDIEDSKKAVEMAGFYGFKASVGIHPHESGDAPENFIELLERLASDRRVVAIGETGLDYFRDLSPRRDQIRVFESQIELSVKLGKPLIIHVRDAYEDVYEVLRSSNLPDPPGVIHAFSAGPIWAERFVDLGFKLGIGGPVTYPKNESLREAVKVVGVENVLTETDCPYLPPQKFRGKRNEPAYVVYVLEKLSEIFGLDLERLSKIIHENALGVFGR